MVKRAEINGAAERGRVYELLGSFDARGLDQAEFERRTLALLRNPAGGTPAAPEDVAAFLRRRFAQPLRAWQTLSAKRNGTAAEILRHKFTFYDEAYELGPALDWESNPGNAHWGHDLNRFSFLHVLRAEWEQTGERACAEKALALILDWIAKTDVCDAFPPGKSAYVWKSYLNIAIHCEVWAQTLAALACAFPDLVPPNAWLRILKSLHDQLAYLSFVIPETRGNWVTIGVRGMLGTLSVFPDFQRTAAWTRECWTRFEEALAEQVLPDGVQDELTPHYHYCVVRNLLDALNCAARLPVAPSPALRKTLREMLLYQRQTQAPDGKGVAFNDSDPDYGPVVALTLAQEDARAALGADADSELTSRCYPYAGVMLLRQGSRRGKDELYLAFDGGPFGTSHQHEDALSFWLCAYGRSFIVDPGRHLYDWSERSFYEYLKSTVAHSTILVDGQNQNSRACRERWKARAPLPLLWEVKPSGEIVAGARYDLGYGPERIPVVHARTITFVPEPGYWIVDDEVSGLGAHALEARFQFAPGALRVEGFRARTLFPDANLLLAARQGEWDEAAVECGQRNPRAGWYSDGINKIEPAPALALRARSRALPFRARFLLLPYRGAREPDWAGEVLERLLAQ